MFGIDSLQALHLAMQCAVTVLDLTNPLKALNIRLMLRDARRPLARGARDSCLGRLMGPKRSAITPDQIFSHVINGTHMMPGAPLVQFLNSSQRR